MAESSNQKSKGKATNLGRTFRMYEKELRATPSVWKRVETVIASLNEKEVEEVVANAQMLARETDDYQKQTGKYVTDSVQLAQGETERGVSDPDQTFNMVKRNIFSNIDRVVSRSRARTNKDIEKIKGELQNLFKVKAPSKFLLQLRDEHNSLLDRLNSMMLAYNSVMADSTEANEAKTQFKDECITMTKEVRNRAINSTSDLIRSHPELEAAAMASQNSVMSIVAGHLEAYSDFQVPTLVKVMDSWEALSNEQEMTYEIPGADVRKMLLGNVKLETPFTTEPVTVTQSASHPTMHATRVAGATVMYTSAAKRCRQIFEKDPNARPVVYDIGAGSFGGQNLIALKTAAANANIYVHASIPDVDNEDTNRINRMRLNPTFTQWNDVSASGIVMRNRINWCKHTLRDCTCMKLYTHVEAIAVHSSYYFDGRDFDNVFKHTDRVTCLEHIPRPGEAIPQAKPEYIWENVASEDTLLPHDFGTRAHAYLYEAITGRAFVRLQPVATGATTYTLPDSGARIRDGGFHQNYWMNMVESAFETKSKLGMFVAGAATAGAVGGLVGSIGQSALCTVANAVVGATSALATTAVAAAFVCADSKRTHPILPGKYSVRTHIASSYQDCNDEQIVHIVIHQKMKYRTELTRSLDEAVRVSHDDLGRVTAAMALAPDNPQTDRILAASMLRDNRPAKMVRATLDHARKTVGFLFNRKPKPRRPQLPLKLALATLCLPFVSGVSQSMTSTIIAELCPLKAPLIHKGVSHLIDMGPIGGLYLLLTAPMHLFGLIVVWSLWDLLVSV